MPAVILFNPWSGVTSSQPLFYKGEKSGYRGYLQLHAGLLTRSLDQCKVTCGIPSSSPSLQWKGAFSPTKAANSVFVGLFQHLQMGSDYREAGGPHSRASGDQLFPVCLYTIQSQGWHIEITRAETCVSRDSDSVRQCNCSLPHALKQRAAEGYSLRQRCIKCCHSCCYSVTWQFKLWCLEEIILQMYFAYEYND